MFIERVQIEEGFLDGLDVSFSRGLNVIIGERGTGKTSLIELVRFCLGVQGYTSDATKRSRDHALSVLGSGQVAVTLSDGERRVLVTRTGGDESPRASESFARPIIFSQTEIETVGLQAQGRLRLLDSFIGDNRGPDTQEAAIASEVRSQTAEAEALRREIEELAHQVQEIPALEKQISEISLKEQQLAKVSAEASDKKTKLDEISRSLASTAVGVSALERFHKAVSRWQLSLVSLTTGAPSVETWPNEAGPDPLAQCRSNIQRAGDYLDKAVQELNQAVQQTEAYLQSSHDNKLKIEEQARQLRKEIDTLQEGAGTTIRHGQQLRERKARLGSLKSVLAERQKSLKSILVKRGVALDKLDAIRQARFNLRNDVARKLAETLGPRIRVKASRAGHFETFAAAIAGCTAR